MANINAQEMQDIKILLPAIEVQDKYAVTFKATMQSLQSHAESARRMTGLLSSLSQKAFAGQL